MTDRDKTSDTRPSTDREAVEDTRKSLREEAGDRPITTDENEGADPAAEGADRAFVPRPMI